MPKTRSLVRSPAQSQWSAAEAKEVLRRQAASGLSVPAFARGEGLSAQRLYWWRHRLSKEATASRDRDFVEVTSLVHEGVHVEVVLRSGRVLRVPAEIEPRLLRRLADALEHELLC